MPSNSGSSLNEKYRDFMARRNGPDRLASDVFILSVVLIVISLFLRGTGRSILLAVGLALLVYGYFRMFSSNVTARSGENDAYVKRRSAVLGRISAPFQRASSAGTKAAQQAQHQARQAQRQMRDREHRYFSCPKCGQSIRVPKGAGKIRVTCPHCGEKFEKKA
jgi:ribosomal protein L37AE/L43A